MHQALKKPRAKNNLDLIVEKDKKYGKKKFGGRLRKPRLSLSGFWGLRDGEKMEAARLGVWDE